MFTEEFYWWELNLVVTRIRVGCQRASTLCRFFVPVTALIIMDHLRLQSAFKFVAISRFGDDGQLMPRSSTCMLKVHSKNSVILP